MKVNVKRLHPDAILPTYATDGAGCFDFYALDDGDFYPVVAPAEPCLCRTGLSFEIPENHVMLIFSRSGHGFTNDVRLANCVGVIDSDYRGEVKVKLTSDAWCSTLNVSPNDRIAQGMIIPYPKVEFVEVGDLSVTERGEGGFGSTG